MPHGVHAFAGSRVLVGGGLVVAAYYWRSTRAVPFFADSELSIYTMYETRPALLEFILTEHSGEKATIVTAPLEFDRVAVLQSGVSCQDPRQVSAPVRGEAPRSNMRL